MNYIHPTAVIYPNVIIEKYVYIGANCIIGAPAEHKDRWQEDGHGVIIKAGSVIHGNCTIDRGLDRPTEIGQKAFIMKGVHIGHDTILHNDVILAPHTLIGGHCSIGAESYFGMGTIVHQRVHVPNKIRTGMGTILTKSTQLWSGGIYIGQPAAFLKWI